MRREEQSMAIEKLIEEFLLERGALKVGIATVETLAGGPPSADITYRMDNARSAISFALPMDRDAIKLFLSKKDRVPHEVDNLSTNVRSKEISWELAEFLKSEGYAAKGCNANMKYRTEMEGWQLLMHPDISHRYLAVRSGVGSFGWSGNVGIEGYGTAIILGATVTDAELTPTDPIPPEKSFCDDCKLCISSCASEMVERDKELSVTLGGETFVHGARKNFTLCHLVCGGFTGLHKSGKWSTWSPGRFEIPDYKDQDALMKTFFRANAAYAKRPVMPGGYQNPALGSVKTYMTCGTCQVVCFGDKSETAANLKLLRSSGCVMQKEDGSLYTLPPDEAAIVFEEMDPQRKSLYC
jgi:epoxyqueuosine reductase